jgi:hypothetical protein
MSKNVIAPTAVEGVGTVMQEGDITVVPVYTFRKLEASDVFLMFKILGKIGINEFAAALGKDSVKDMFNALSGDNDDNDDKDGIAKTMGIAVMLEIANIVISNIPKCELEIFQMLSNTSNLSVEQVRKLDIATFAAMVIDFAKKDEFGDFLQVVSKLFN